MPLHSFVVKNMIETRGQFQCFENPISIDLVIYALIGVLLLFFMLDIALNVRLSNVMEGFLFSETEWSLENLLIYEDILKYEKLLPNERREFATLIYNTYMNGEASKLEVNLPGKISRELKDKIDDLDVELKSDLFDDIIYVAKDNLEDTFARFIISDEYLNLTKKLEFIRSEADLKSEEIHSSTENIL
eukprot:gene8649-596_t